MSTNRFQKPNEAIEETFLLDNVLELLYSEIENISIDWVGNLLQGASEDLSDALSKVKLGEAYPHGLLLNSRGRSFLLRVTIDWGQILNEEISDKFRFLKEIGSGRESIVYLAEHRLMGKKVAIKIFYDRDAAQRYQSLFSQLEGSDTTLGDVFILPNDILEIGLRDIRGNLASVVAVIFPFRKGETISDFIINERPLTPFLVREFLSQVGGGLARLHRLGISHGDLHEDNIIVEELGNSVLRFSVVDFTGSAAQFAGISQDWDAFRGILMLLLAKIPIKHMSLQRHLGAKTFCVVKAIIESDIDNAVDLERILKDNSLYRKYTLNRDTFIQKKFRVGDTLGLVRHEEITNPAIARELFVPYEPFFQEFSEFGGAILHGHRGSGKSSYVAALAMLPGAAFEFVDPRDKFGILFACRQGEFKQLRAIRIDKNRSKYGELKHLMIVKIIRKTLETLGDALSYNSLDLRSEFDIDPIVGFLSACLPVGTSGTFESSSYERLQSLYEAMVRYELEFTDLILADRSEIGLTTILGERHLIGFLEAIRGAAGVLSSTRFYLLFDDSGTPNMPESMQRVLNELLRATNEIFCVKITAERFSYIEEDSDSKVLESPHDYTPFNLAETLILRGGQQVERKEIQEYFVRLLSKRLTSYKSSSIVSFLGQQFEPASKFIQRLSENPKAEGAYAGWAIIWQVADRTPRHLLEIVSIIFSRAGIRYDSPPEVISAKIQDEAVRSYSEAKLRYIAYIPGKLEVGGITISLGQHLYNITVAFGRICRRNLDRGRMKGERNRYYESLAIEIDRRKKIGRQAETILRQLIRYAIFDDSIFGTTREGGLRQPIFIFNRIYAPAFGIGLRREVHWTIRTERFERFLLDPNKEILKFGQNDRSDNLDLFPDE